MNYYNEIKEQIKNNELVKKIKDYSKNRIDLNTYYNVSKLLSEAGKHYGKGIIKEYAERLSNDLNKHFSIRSLYNMRLYFEKICCNEKLQPVAAILTWSHYCELLRINDDNKILYYINICNQQNLSKRELIQRIKSNEFERLPEETKNKLIEKHKINIKDLIKNPIIINTAPNKIETTDIISSGLIINNSAKSANTTDIVISVQLDLFRNFSNIIYYLSFFCIFFSLYVHIIS